MAKFAEVFTLGLVSSWPLTIMEKPSKAVRVLLFALPLELEIAATALGCSYFTRLRSQLIDLQF